MKSHLWPHHDYDAQGKNTLFFFFFGLFKVI